MKFAYSRNGAPLLSWKRAAPSQSRAADARALGSLGGDTLDAMPLPVPGGPEPLGCSGCAGSMGGIIRGGRSMAGVVDTIQSLPTAAKVAGAVGLYFFYKKMKKRR